MNETILESLIERGAISQEKLLFALLGTGKIDVGAIIKETGLTDTEMLVSLHQSDELDVIQLIRETVSNIKVKIEDMTSAEAVVELRKTATYLESLAQIIEDIDNGIENVENIAEDAPAPITVVRSVV